LWEGVSWSHFNGSEIFAFAILVLKEAPHRPKLAGVTAMFTGLILVATG
jgi:hypothetical protein